MRKAGMTLLEMLIVVVIAGVLATLGFVNYSGVREHSLGKEAIANLKLIAAAERIYRMEYGFYFPTTAAPFAGSTSDAGVINTGLRLSLTTSRWTYGISGANTTQFTAAADRVGAGGNLDCQFQLTQSQEHPTANANCP